MVAESDLLHKPCRPGETLVGRWTYRSFKNDPDITKDFTALEFGRAEMLVEYLDSGVLVGRLVFGETYQFRLQGVPLPGDPPTLRFRGVGDAGESQGQIYDYFGCLMPMSPIGIEQRATITGIVVRVVPHNGDKQMAGVVASFIALKQ